MTFLLDTNVVSEPSKAVPDEILVAKLKIHERDCAIATVVWHELLYGVSRLAEGKKKNALNQYLSKVVAPAFPLLPYDSKAAVWHADERVRLTKEGRPPSFVDAQIAAIAAINNLTLITRNVKDFKQFKGLRVENWFA